jgi:hypothetical protein
LPRRIDNADAPLERCKQALTKVGAEETGAACDEYPLNTLCFIGNAFI